jgi:hypothetical protein
VKLRLHGISVECAAVTERLRRTPGLYVTDESRPVRTAPPSWSASTSLSTSTPPATTSPAQVAVPGEGRRG